MSSTLCGKVPLRPIFITNLPGKRFCLQTPRWTLTLKAKAKELTYRSGWLLDSILCGTPCLVKPPLYPSRNVMDGRCLPDGPLTPSLTWSKIQKDTGPSLFPSLRAESATVRPSEFLPPVWKIFLHASSHQTPASTLGCVPRICFGNFKGSDKPAPSKFFPNKQMME